MAEIIDIIVAADNRAKQLTSQAKEKQEKAYLEVNDKISSMRNDALTEAYGEIAKTREAARKNTENTASMYNDKYKRLSEIIKTEFAENREKWADDIFNKVITVGEEE